VLGEKVAFESNADAERATVCGELDALSVAVRVADAAPVVVGLNVICKLHVAPEAKVVVQVLA
jgi:hypothetical protein